MTSEIEQTFSRYPKPAAKALASVRGLILETAIELKIDELTETLKWGEPSILSKHASTIRYDWKEKTPENCVVLF